ncbi:MAG: hypothetical protein KKH12_10345 [Gammaproteobacteria bacterium]|nr:hypothetical protein [Gammaproteobacteria bacterium]MBU1482060.1 hypothetical protein [Gammaproteobacteria bacterium]
MDAAIPHLLAGVLCGYNLFACPCNAAENNMSDLIKDMRPVCLGRIVVEMPTVAKINGWEHEVDRTKIETVDHPSPNRKYFDTKIARP